MRCLIIRLLGTTAILHAEMVISRAVDFLKFALAGLFAFSCLPVFSQVAFQPQPILKGGEVIPLYPADSPFLDKKRIAEPELYNTSFDEKPAAIINVIQIHNPSIEIHLAPDDEKNTGTFIILAPGGGHKILWVGPEGAAWVPHFARMGISTGILRNRLRSDGYEPTTDATFDAQQAIRIVRANAEKWRLDPNKIGMMGFSAGAELAAPAALDFRKFEEANCGAGDPLAGVSARPDFIGILYPGPTPFSRDPAAQIPRNVPPSFIACSGRTDKIHALWAADWFHPMLKAGVPNVEMHIFARGEHGGQVRGPGEIPYAAWPDRFNEWLADLGLLGKRGEPTRAAKDVEEFVKEAGR